MKYTKELLEPIVKKSLSVADVLRSLNLPLNSGGIHQHISCCIKKFDLDVSHFLGVRSNCGIRHKGGPRKRSAHEILTLKTTGYGEKTAVLRRALFEIGRRYECKCGIKAIWNGRPLTLQIEHINGNSLDDRPDNLEFLCPNCHSQTVTYAKIKSVLR